MKRIIFRINKFFATRKIKKDRKKNGVWSDQILDPRSGRCISEAYYIGNVTSREAEEAAKLLLGLK